MPKLNKSSKELSILSFGREGNKTVLRVQINPIISEFFTSRGAQAKPSSSWKEVDGNSLSYYPNVNDFVKFVQDINEFYKFQDLESRGVLIGFKNSYGTQLITTQDASMVINVALLRTANGGKEFAINLPEDLLEEQIKVFCEHFNTFVTKFYSRMFETLNIKSIVEKT